MLHVEMLKFWYVCSLSFGLWACLSLVLSKFGRRRINYLLALYTFLLLIIPINAYLTHVLIAPLPWLVSITQNLTLVYGPLLYIFITYALRIPTRFQAWHFLPFVCINVDRILGLYGIGPFVFDYDIWSFLLIILHITLYAVHASYLVFVNKRRLSSMLVEHKYTTHYWLSLLCFSLLFLSILDVVILSLFIFGAFPDLKVVSILACLVGIYVSIIGLFSVNQPNIFSQLQGGGGATEAKHESFSRDDTKVRNTELSPEVAKSLQTDLDNLVRVSKPHLSDNVSLHDLASSLGINRNQLSELFNVHMSTSFYDFLNELRYEEALTLLHDKQTKYTVEDIAYQSGFNNRNSFYKVFREKTGLTPAQYRKQKASEVLEQA